MSSEAGFLSIKYKEYGSHRDMVKIKCTVCPAQQKIDKLHFLSLFGELEGLLHIYLFYFLHFINGMSKKVPQIHKTKVIHL